MILYLIRHAEPDYETDTITETGKKQAAMLGKWFKEIPLDAIYHSSMGRAEMTASYIAKEKNMSLTPLDWAREIAWGKADGNPYDSESPWVIKDHVIEKIHSYPDGENWRNLKEFSNDIVISDIDAHIKNFDDFILQFGYERKNKFYKAVNPNEKSIALVCHGGVISALISHLINIPFFQYIAHMGSDLTAVTKINFYGTTGESVPAQLIYVNSQIHLDKK